jgi:hypothetical protein
MTKNALDITVCSTMTDLPETGAPLPPKNEIGESNKTTAGVPSGANGESLGGSDVSKLSKEEQMARFEEALKESDWGHQPC